MLWGSVLDLSGDNGVEFLLGDKTVLINVGSDDKLVDLLVGDVLA